MKRALFASLCLTFAFACTPDAGGDTDGDETTAGDGDGDTDDTDGDGDGDDEDSSDTLPDTETTDTGSTGPAEPVGTIVGVTLDEANMPLPSPGLQFCGPVNEEGIAELCIPFDVEADGTFTIEAPQVGTWNLKMVHADTEGGRKFGGQAFPIEITDGAAIDINDAPIIVPEVFEVSLLTEGGGEQTVGIEGGLSITLDPDLSQTTSFAAPTELGGRLVDPTFWRYSGVNGEPMVAGWSFAPFGVKAKEGAFGISFTDTLGLEAGSAVKVYEVEKDNAALHHIGDGTVTDSGIDVTPVGEGLHELSWVIVTQ